MAKGKKKKKDLDFQKVKLKVGRKLKRDTNETKAEFKTRKIILKEVRSYSDDPLTALARHSEHISQHGKLSMLNHFNSALTPNVVKNLNKPILDSLAKFVVDHSDQVRAATFKCLKTCYNHVKQQHLSTRDFILSLKPYLDCAYTHVSPGVMADCHKFLEYLVNTNDPQLFEPLMRIILRRYEVGNLSTKDKSVAIKLRQYYTRFKQKQAVASMLEKDKLEPLIWTEKNHFLDLDIVIHDLEGNRWDSGALLREKSDSHEDVAEKYLKIVKVQESSLPSPPDKKLRMFH